MDLKLLREATRPEHEATEATVSLMGPELTRAEYVTVLQRFHRVVCAWESVAAAEAPAALAELVAQRGRCGSIVTDLRFFGTETQGNPPDVLLQQIRDLVEANGRDEGDERTSRFLGAMYVLEGSTLGGQYIAHHVEAALQLQPGEGDRFFRGYGKETMPKWREFQQALVAIPDEQSDIVIAAAKGMFGIFCEWMAGGAASAPEQKSRQATKP
ncbi:biliverdin-producing heme oxygenase [Terriglobus sp.]|uniref:biliverdin-producing heme oxygenase n=1 Tax=Terriglobus sp. TaxID=1889013 RepID=UPI003AFF9312